MIKSSDPSGFKLKLLFHSLMGSELYSQSLKSSEKGSLQNPTCKWTLYNTSAATVPVCKSLLTIWARKLNPLHDERHGEIYDCKTQNIKKHIQLQRPINTQESKQHHSKQLIQEVFILQIIGPSPNFLSQREKPTNSLWNERRHVKGEFFFKWPQTDKETELM